MAFFFVAFASCACAALGCGREMGQSKLQQNTSSSKQNRVKYYQSNDTINELHECISPDFGAILYKGGWKYPSRDMKKGIDVDMLKLHSPALQRLMSLDARGGYFRQRQMHEAFAKETKKPEYEGFFLSMCSTLGYANMHIAVVNVAYTTRVMLAHLREKHSAYLTSTNPTEGAHPDELKAIYSVMQVSSKQVAKETRIHPLYAFRSDEEESGEDEESDDDDLISIYRYFEVSTNKAMLILSDGSHLPATKYTSGPNGLAIAQWGERCETLELEVPNNMISADGKKINGATIVDPKELAKRNKSGKKRPAAADEESNVKSNSRIAYAYMYKYVYIYVYT